MSSLHKSRIGKRNNFIDKLIKDTSERTYRSKARKRYTPKVSRGGDTTPEYSRIEGYSSHLQSSEKLERDTFKTILNELRDIPQPDFGDTKQSVLSELEYIHQQRKIKLNPNYQPTKNGVHDDKLVEKHADRPTEQPEANYWHPPIVYPKYYEEVSESKGPVKAQVLSQPEVKNEQNLNTESVEQPVIEPIENTFEEADNESVKGPEVDEDPTPEPDQLPPQQIENIAAFNPVKIPIDTVEAQITTELEVESPEVPTYHPLQEPIIENSKIEEEKQVSEEIVVEEDSMVRELNKKST